MGAEFSHGRKSESLPIRLMVVDDSIVARSVFQTMLAPFADFHIVATASSADQALARLAETPVDIVLLDLAMPGMDGLTALPEIIRRGAGARVLVVSASAGEGADACVRALTLGAADTLEKPHAGAFGNKFGIELVEKLRRIASDGVCSRRAEARERETRAGAAAIVLPAEPMRPGVAGPIDCIAIGEKLGSKALTVWIADGSNFAGQSNLTRALDLYLESMRAVYAALPGDWRVFLEHKLYEPAFYSTVISDWGTSFAAAQELGPKAQCLVDLGHHAPNVNIEQIVARLVRFKKLGGFHFNDSKYGDDDLDAGSVEPFRLFLVFNELIDATTRNAEGFAPAYMIDQSHNVTDPIESLMQSAIELQRAYAQALIVDREALGAAQNAHDALGAHLELKRAFTADVSPLLAMARRRAGGAIEPIETYRASGYRERKAKERPAVAGTSAGIV